MGNPFQPASPRLLVAEPPGAERRTAALCRALGRPVHPASSAAQALAACEGHEIALVLVDAGLDGGAGLELLGRLAAREPHPPLLFLVERGDVARAVEAMRKGALDVVEGPATEAALARALALIDRPSAPDAPSTRTMVGRSRQLERTLRHVERAAATPRTTVLVSGESGVGKELVARAVHERSSRGRAPFVAVNCAALAENLLEAELFGYEPGAFTGGDPKGRRGLVAAAEGGTLFLDEVGELAPDLQAKLLRVLQERTYRRVGGDADHSTDVRFVASTNRDLAAMVEAGTFREDLFYRLNVLSIVVPPLRERPEDIEPLALHFLEHFGSELRRRFAGFDPAALETLRRHAWPGNVRELRNAVERAAVLAPGGEVRPHHLGLPSRAPADPRARRPAPAGVLTLREIEQVLIERVLDECAGNRSRAARELGIHRATLHNKLRQYGLGA